MENSTKEFIPDPDEVRERLQRLRLKQADLIRPLHEMGLDASPSQISLAVNGKGLAPRFQKILRAIYAVIEKEEKKFESH